MDDNKHDDDFNPIGTVWILVGFFILIALFWGWAYLDLLMSS